MAWVQQLPLLVRSIPALTFVLLCVAIFVFLARHPVDGDQRVAEAGLKHARAIVIVFGVAIFCMAPSWLMLSVLLMLVISVLRYGHIVMRLVSAQMDRNSFV